MDAPDAINTILDWSYGGVNNSLPGNGGPDCAYFLSTEQKLVETIAASLLSVFYIYWASKRLPLAKSAPYVGDARVGKNWFLAVLCLVFGTELYYKLACKQLIFLLNPCHIMTMVQIYLLAAPPSNFNGNVFRLQFNLLNGPILAMLFPVTNTRFLPFEWHTYWIQHAMLLITPYYLMRQGGVYTASSLEDPAWPVFSAGVFILYHFLPLQLVAHATQINLNNMLCPAPSDPLHGQFYRVAAVVHQSVAVPLFAKLLSVTAEYFIVTCPYTKVKDGLQNDLSKPEHQPSIQECQASKNKQMNLVANDADPRNGLRIRA